MVTRIIPVFVLAAALALTSACAGDKPAGGDAVVAAFYPLAFAAEAVGQGARVENLTPSGAEPHDLELSARDVATVHDAALVVYLGQGFQPGLEDAIADRSGPALDLLAGRRLLAAGSRAAAREPRDAHVWLDPRLYAKLARSIATQLGHPSSADGFAVRLEELDAELASGLRTCEHRQIVTSHAAFGYFADRYDLEQVPLAGLSPESEPSPRDLEKVVDEVKQTGATTVFLEPLVAPDLAETVARETGAVTAVLNPIEGLTDEQVEEGADYFSIMRENLAALRRGLGCT
jgi:zinc transport system substrate-binding protein